MIISIQHTDIIHYTSEDLLGTNFKLVMSFAEEIEIL